MTNQFLVDKEHENMRIDKFSRKYSKLESLSQILAIIRKGKLKINNKKVKENYRLNIDDLITFSQEIKFEFNNYVKVKDDKFKDMIVFEDDNIFIINKPNNIAMHKGNKHKYGLAEMAKNYFKSSNINFANRLDLDTQGLVIGTKNLNILRKISEEIKNKNVIKKYIAIVENKNLKINQEFIIEKKVDDKYAKTKFKIIDIIEDKAILDINLETGRKHQIRIHLKSINLPIIGDCKYMGKKSDKLYLKCYHLKFLDYDIKISKTF